MCDAMGDVGRDGLRRVVAKWREARPIVDVDQHGAVGLRKGDIAPEHLEPEHRRGLERERLEPVLVHRGPLAREPRLRAVPVEETTVGHAVELHDRTGRSEEHTSELQSLAYLVCRLLLEKKKIKNEWKHTRNIASIHTNPTRNNSD